MNMRTMMAKLIMTTVRPLPTSTGESVMDTSSAAAKALRNGNALTVGDFEKKTYTSGWGRFIYI